MPLLPDDHAREAYNHGDKSDVVRESEEVGGITRDARYKQLIDAQLGKNGLNLLIIQSFSTITAFVLLLFVMLAYTTFVSESKVCAAPSALRDVDGSRVTALIL